MGLLLVTLPACRRTSSDAPAPAPAPTSTPASAPLGLFDSPRAAFERALALAGDPLVLGVGEVHAPRGATASSAARRFATEMLPALEGRASDLLLELMMPPAGCTDAVAQARKSQEPVTSRHAETDQDDYLAMGQAARALGIVPDMLRPTCADMDAIEHAGEDAIDVSLATIARLSGAQAARLADRDARVDEDRGKIVVVYGGALHNDLSPAPDTAAARWSYAPALDLHVGGRFASIDLFVPEFIGMDAGAQAFLSFWPSYDPQRMGDRTALFRTGPRSFALVFPRTHPAP
jgi:hypothetical protein